MIKHLFLAGILLLPVFVAAAEESTEQVDADETKQAPGEEPASAETQPDPGSLRRMEISEAFERFKPSEEISADNAVPFPVDI